MLFKHKHQQKARASRSGCGQHGTRRSLRRGDEQCWVSMGRRGRVRPSSPRHPAARGIRTPTRSPRTTRRGAGAAVLRLPRAALSVPSPALPPERSDSQTRTLLYPGAHCPLAGSLLHAAPRAGVGAASQLTHSPGTRRGVRGGRAETSWELPSLGVFRAQQRSPGRAKLRAAPGVQGQGLSAALPQPYLSFSVSRSFSKCRWSFWPGGAPMAQMQNMLLDWFPV